MDTLHEHLQISGYEHYVKLFEALSHPVRIKIVGLLAEERQYVSELARILNISRPLLYMHLKKLETAGIITGKHEISQTGKATKYFETRDFSLSLTPQLLIDLAKEIPVTPTPQPNAKSASLNEIGGNTMNTVIKNIAKKSFNLEFTTLEPPTPAEIRTAITTYAKGAGNNGQDAVVVFTQVEMPVQFTLDGTPYTTKRGTSRGGPTVLCVET